MSITRSVGAPRGAFLDFPLGHTAGKPQQPELQRAIVMEALAGFRELQTPGEIKRLPFVWSQDENWREPGLGALQDSRTPRDESPQYQTPADREAAEAAG